MESEIITFSLIVLVLSIGIFFFVENAQQNLSFVGKKFFSGEIWRIVTFNFVHLSLSHLIGNVIAFIITTMLSFEVGLKSEYFIMLFFVSATSIALIEGIFFPGLIIAGASLGIYSILGGISISGRRLIPLYFFLPLIVLSIFLNKFFLDTVTFFEIIFHFFGFLSGLLLYYGIVKYINKKKSYLEVVE
ncbi:rhomboid family intramembrane serine protease [Candidatus Woesearchaeota archaeon]|nr:rhomboid family intramembrane serine protease [Candidatus Woesearchaeota archaeon]